MSKANFSKEEIDDFAQAFADAQRDAHPQDEEAIAVCMPRGPSPYDDNLTANCAICGCEIMHRPWVDTLMEKHKLKTLIKACMDCAMGMAGEKH